MSNRCQHYWGRYVVRCLLHEGHEGEHGWPETAIAAARSEGRREGVEEARQAVRYLAAHTSNEDEEQRIRLAALHEAQERIRSLAASSPKRGDADDGMVCTSCGQPAMGVGAALDPSHVCGPAPSSGSRDDGLRERVVRVLARMHTGCDRCGRDAIDRGHDVCNIARDLRRALASGGDHGSNDGRK